MCRCRKLYKAEESIDFQEQMRFVNLQRLLHGLQTVKLSTCVSLKNEQVVTDIVHCSLVCSLRGFYEEVL